MIFKLINGGGFPPRIERYFDATDIKNNKWAAFLYCYEIDDILSYSIKLFNEHDFVIYNKQYLKLYHKYKRLAYFK